MISCYVCFPKFTLRTWSVRDRPTLLLTKYKEKMRNEEQGSGMKYDEETEFSNSLIIHAFTRQSGFANLVRCVWFETPMKHWTEAFPR